MAATATVPRPASTPEVRFEPYAERPVIVLVPTGVAILTVEEAEAFVLQLRTMTTQAKARRVRPPITQERLSI